MKRQKEINIPTHGWDVKEYTERPFVDNTETYLVDENEVLVCNKCNKQTNVRL